jgi:hypothetical protein
MTAQTSTDASLPEDCRNRSIQAAMFNVGPNVLVRIGCRGDSVIPDEQHVHIIERIWNVD